MPRKTHFFFECTSTTQIWQEIENKFTALTGKRIKLKSTEAILGYVPDYKMGKKQYCLINKLILIGKKVISAVKYGPRRNALELLESELFTYLEGYEIWANW